MFSLSHTKEYLSIAHEHIHVRTYTHWLELLHTFTDKRILFSHLSHAATPRLSVNQSSDDPTNPTNPTNPNTTVLGGDPTSFRQRCHFVSYRTEKLQNTSLDPNHLTAKTIVLKPGKSTFDLV